MTWLSAGADIVTIVGVLGIVILLSDRFRPVLEAWGLSANWLGENKDEVHRAAVLLYAMFEYNVWEVRLARTGFGLSLCPLDDHGYERDNLIFPGYVLANSTFYHTAVKHLEEGGYLKPVGKDKWEQTDRMIDAKRQGTRRRKVLYQAASKEKESTLNALRNLENSWWNAKYKSETIYEWSFETTYTHEGHKYVLTVWYLPPHASEYGVQTRDGKHALELAALVMLPDILELRAGNSLNFTTDKQGYLVDKPDWWFDEGMQLLRLFRPGEWNNLPGPNIHIPDNYCMAWVGHFPAKVSNEPIKDLDWDPVEDFRRDSDEIMQLKEYRDLFRSYREWLSDQEEHRPNRME